MEAADGDADAERAQFTGDGHGTRELIGLHPDQTHDARVTWLLDARGDAPNRNLDVHLVIGIDLDGHILAQDATVGAILRDRVKAGHRIRWNPSPPPLNDVTILVVVRWLDDIDVERRHVDPANPVRRS